MTDEARYTACISYLSFVICHLSFRMSLRRIRRQASQFAFNEFIESAVHHALDVTGLDPGAVVFDHLIRLENIGSNLASPGDFAFLPVLPVNLGLLFVLVD